MSYFLVRDTEIHKFNADDVIFSQGANAPAIVYAESEDVLINLGVKTICDVTALTTQLKAVPKGYFPSKRPDPVYEWEYLETYEHKEQQKIADPTDMVGKFVYKESWGSLSKTMHYIISMSDDKMAVLSASWSAKGFDLRMHFLDSSVTWYATDFQHTAGNRRKFITGVTEEQFLKKLRLYRPSAGYNDIPNLVKRMCAVIPEATRNEWPSEPMDAAYSMIDQYYKLEL